VIGIVTGLVQALPGIMQALVDALPGLLRTLTDFMASNAPMLLQAVLDIVAALVKAAPEIARAIYPMIPQIMDMVVEGVMDFIPVWIDTAKTMFGVLADAIPDLWENVKKASAEVFEQWKTNIFDRARDAFGEIWDHIKDKVTPVGKKIGDAVGGAFKGAVNAVLDHIEERLNSIPNAINGAIDLLNALPGVNISPMDTISLPRLAQGGIVSKATLAQIGEAGREAIIPLEKNKAGLREIARLLQSEMKGAAGSGAPGVSGKQNQGVVINMTQNNTSPKALSAYEIWRQTKNMTDLIKQQLEGVK
jgi:phage-related protein